MELVAYLTTEKIAERVQQLAAQIRLDYRDRHPMFVAVLRGSFIFAADLFRAVAMNDAKIDFLAVRSYGAGTESTGAVQFVKDLSEPIEGQDVILVEDIVDTGLTMAYLLDTLRARKPKTMAVCSLLHKPSRTRVTVPIDYLGFTIDDEFVVGYGLDFGEKYRGLPYIATMKQSR
jgi:hypoxanthine phosphoribosyltransferase